MHAAVLGRPAGADTTPVTKHMVKTRLRVQGEEEKSTDQRHREKVVREDFLEVAVLELGEMLCVLFYIYYY